MDLINQTASWRCPAISKGNSVSVFHSDTNGSLRPHQSGLNEATFVSWVDGTCIYNVWNEQKYRKANVYYSRSGERVDKVGWILCQEVCPQCTTGLLEKISRNNKNKKCFSQRSLNTIKSCESNLESKKRALVALGKIKKTLK